LTWVSNARTGRPTSTHRHGCPVSLAIGNPGWDGVSNFGRLASRLVMLSSGSAIRSGRAAATVGVGTAPGCAGNAPPVGLKKSADDEPNGYWSGVVGPTFWFYLTGECTNEAWGAYIAHCTAMLDSGIDRPAMIYLAHRAQPPTGDQRRQMGDFIAAESKRLRALTGFVLVLDSPLHIMALKAINWLVKKPFPETVCGTPGVAAAWLRQRGAPIDSTTLMRALEKTVPSEHMWPS
jgi:hypothetical protein